MGKLTGTVWSITWLIIILVYTKRSQATLFPYPYSFFINQPGNHVCVSTRTVETKYTVKCSFWKWGRCTKYKDKTLYNYFCCSGYQNWVDDLTVCNHAICNRRINPEGDGACTQYYSNDYIQYRSGSTQRHSGGSCNAPEQCSNCNDGFYANGGMCEICPKIDRCLHRKCTSPSDNHCAYCDGAIREEQYWRAYTSATDNQKSCKQACSWRSDSTRCYPGKCSAETSASCVCMQGFTGHHCDEIIDAPSVSDQQAVLKDLNGRTVENPTDLSGTYSDPMPTVWTNNGLINRVSAYFTGVFKVDVPVADLPPTPSSDGTTHYVTDFQYGIIGGEIKFTLYRGSTTVWPYYTRKCQGSDMNPTTAAYTCSKDITFSAWSDFRHNDKLYFDMSVKNGGYVRIVHRENRYAQTLFKLKGKTHSRRFMYHFDMELPYHACAASGGTSCGQAVTAPDLTDNPSISFSWDGWADDLSGLGKYEYEVYFTRNIAGQLTEDSLLPGMPVVMPATQSSATFTLTTPGMYMLLLHVIDNAGNIQSARKVFLYDNMSEVEKRTGKYARVTTASSNTSYDWVVKDTNTVDVLWTDLFINERHKDNHWLNEIKPFTDVSWNYDDRFGNRTTARIDHVNGIVDFWVSFAVYTDSGTLKDSQVLTTVKPNIHDQSTSLTVDWEDGDKLNVTVRAIDVMQKYDDVELTVYRDHTPPVIRDLWLTRGGRTNLSVHSLEDFTTMTIEWETYDFHSGIDTLYWKLYDNYTDTVIQHGHEDLVSQREDDLASCQATYGGDPGDCYCSPYQGCFHQHFTVTPEIKLGAGLVLAHANGKHDSDYYIEIQVTNIAKLVTTLRKKITIDVSPPHTGVVHDGVRGSLEVDYQQSFNLHAHWEGFFDRESGVKMYLYKFATSCQDAATMVLDSTDPNVIETTDTDVSYTATSDGEYFVTVVAFNHALEPSTPVCSDGVTIDSGVTAVREISVDTAKVRGGLVTDPGATAVWILDTDRSLRQLSSTSAACRAKATVVSDLELFPRTRYANQTEVVVDGDTFCDNSTGAPSPVAMMLRKSSSLTVSWMVEDTIGGVFDHEFGLASAAGGSAAPNIFGYVSTKQNTHITLHHEDVSTGVQFYMAIKTISKTETENIQTLGPFLLDTTAPTFSGAVALTLVSEYLVASWTSSAFQDTEEYYELFYTFAIGHSEYAVDVQQYKPLSGGATCTLSVIPDCTAALVADLDWDLHGHHSYYVTVRAENSVGLFVMATSSAYIHDVQLAARGVVLDVPVGSDKDSVPYTDIEDSDFQTDQTKLQARWMKFDHPYLNITYRIAIGTTPGGAQIYGPASVASQLAFEKTGLSLVHWQTYYFTVEAVTSVGSVNVTSDGITVVQEGATLTGVNVFDGKLCNFTVDNGTLFHHHEQDHRVRCDLERNYQTSLSTIQAYWTIPSAIRYYTPDAHWAVEEEDAAGGGIWTVVREFEHLSTSFEAEANDLLLLPGRSYRVALKLCAGMTCYAPIYTDGVLILSSPPVTGNLLVTHFNLTTGGGVEKLMVQMDRFYDSDIADPTAKFEAVEKYEWAITDNSVSGKIFTKWTNLDTFTISSEKMTFELSLTGEMDFSRCKRLSVRGYNKANLWSVVSSQILDCAAFAPILINPNTIIDAVGEQEYDETGTVKNDYGKEIFLKENALWTFHDVDYTPYSNMISAVWPHLRHRNYTYAVLRSLAVDVTSYYRPTSLLSLPDPCSHPDSLKCGHTDKEYVNIEFGPGELQHGSRYIVCLHADITVIQQETWVQTLEAVSVCSDGVVVDLSPPTPGNVWIGHTPGSMFQTTLTDIYVNWETFVDVEEYSTASHSTGIQAYTVSIGTTAGGNDMVDFTDVGASNHIAFHGLQLQNGHTYYATVTAMDFARRNTTQTSPGVVVDVTPPRKSDKPIVIDRHFNSRTGIGACWIEVFDDLESGIQRYTWAVGSEPGYDDILSYTDVGDIVCAVQDENVILDLHEGHAYYITVKAYNGAGLNSQASSWAITVDLSPPVAGHVYDGKRDNQPSNMLDRDFQTDRSYIAAFWEGFHDPHSNIREYSVSIGTCRGCQEVLETQAVGITNEFVLSMKHLGVGLTYYTTVTACNTANLCSSVTSDGVILDNSPPTAGVVQDGTFPWDIHYQAVPTYIGAKWYGFSDPQSELDHYEWWAGTDTGSDNVMAKQILHLSEVATNPTVPSLPIDQTIYITVRAYNKAGLYVDSVSNGFKVDISHPVITKPVLSSDFGVFVSGKLFLRDSFKVTWTAVDQESHIERQHLSIKAHRNGEFQLSPTKVNGILRDFTFTGLDLHDGVNYYVNLIACNGAGKCTQTESDAIFVDSSPPSRGMFSIKTNHASLINRDVPNSMTWTSRALFLSWIGFADLHSEVSNYFINVGSTYMAADLNKIIGTPGSVSHSNTSDVYDEGHIQSAKIDTQDLSKASNTLFIHMWAVNKVGLSSPIIHSMFKMIAGGSLELMRRCDSYSCLGHCVCAPQDTVCPYSHLDPCTNYTSQDNPNSPLDVTDFGITAYTATNMGLGAVWRVSNFDGLQPLWYEWSVGYEFLASPEGIFHQADERIWHDAGQNMQHLFLVTRAKSSLSEGIAYAFFVRVWYASNVYAIYKSNGVTIMTIAPTPTVIRGSAVTESNHKYSHKDMDYLEVQPFMVSWKNKFLQSHTYIKSFNIYLSTMPGGDDVYKVAASFPGTITSYNFTRFRLDPRIKYYTNIVAYSLSGQHHTESSDGFVIDNVVPVMGSVYDGTGSELHCPICSSRRGIHDLEYQSSRSKLGATWHGFVDLDAGVKTYYWCVGTTQSKTECSIKTWEAVGLRTAVSTNLSTALSHGWRVYNKVYAVDGLGQKSDTAVSDGVTVDTTPPYPEQLVHLDNINVAANPSFENSGGHSIPWDKVNSTDICNVNSTLLPDIWTSAWDTCVAVVSSDTNLAKDGRSMVIVRGMLSQDISGLEMKGLYRITFVTSHLPSVDSVIANKEGFVEFGNRHVFLLYTKAYRLDDHGSDTRETISWHLHTFYFEVTSTTMTLSLGSLDRGTGILIDDVQVHHVTRNTGATSDTVNAHVVFLHEWGSIHGSWSFLEAESHITEYLWAIGYKKGGTQVQDFRSVGQQRFAYNNTVTLVHTSEIYITVVATSTSGLQSIAYSPPILVDLTPPIFTAVSDGSGTGTTELDLDSWEQDEVLVNWQVHDPESGLDFCEWAIGYQPFGNELQTFTRIADNVFTGQIQDVGYANVEGMTVYSTIRCQNKAGVQSVSSSDGVRISRLSPAVDNVQFSTIGLTHTEFSAAPHFQADTTQVRLKWSGFRDSVGIEGFIFRLDDRRWKMLAYDQEETYVWIHGLELSEGEHDLDISAVNLQYRTSPKVTANLTVLTHTPTTHVNTPLDVTWDDTRQELTIAWDSVFTSTYELFYEVSAGSNLGSGDIVQWMETTASSMTLTIPSVITNLSNLRIYVSVRAVTLSGKSAVKLGSVQLPAS
ncbi:uncharacterized protein LOC110452658 [Mizuhopecten yessoensis]|uniref:uncharacterized protein LOC110452658 n=1 Tax=Mizuhopecten yessoensis TaxID=6573 RepID=UPI000B45C5C9|nr:uncharacterized protein LOC110452658 [Mizuhopecten yessoensis]